MPSELSDLAEVKNAWFNLGFRNIKHKPAKKQENPAKNFRYGVRKNSNN